MKQDLMRYIPKNFKALVADIYEGEKEWNEVTNRWNVPVVIEWQNGETSIFANKTFIRGCLNEFHSPEEYC